MAFPHIGEDLTGGRSVKCCDVVMRRGATFPHIEMNIPDRFSELQSEAERYSNGLSECEHKYVSYRAA